MQTDYLFRGLKGYAKVKRFSYLFSMNTKEATNRYKILRFLYKYGINATKDAYEISVFIDGKLLLKEIKMR
jgi:hypothetical protein